MAQITPPVGFNLFVLQGMTRRQINYIARRGVPVLPDDGDRGARHLVLPDARHLPPGPDEALGRRRRAATMRAARNEEEQRSMHVIVVGAGIIGVCTAYFLRRAGIDVTVVERRPGVAQETSFANAGVMAPSYVAPWAAAGHAGQGRRLPLQGRGADRLPARREPAPCGTGSGAGSPSAAPNASPATRRACSGSPSTARSRSARCASCTRSTTSSPPGYLQLFRDRAGSRAFGRHAQDAHRTGRRAPPARRGDEARAVEVALHPVTPLAGALHLPDDETGNCAFFAHQLKDIAARDGVRFRFGETVQGVRPGAGPHRVPAHERRANCAATRTSSPAGSTALRLLRPLGIRLPLMAVKGYSATAADHGARAGPMTSVMDETYKVAITPHGQPPADRRHRGNRHQRHEAARQRAEHADQGRERLVSRRGRLPQGAVLGRRAPDAARRPAGARREPDPEPVPEHRPRLHRVGRWRAARARCWPTSSEVGRRRSISTG